MLRPSRDPPRIEARRWAVRLRLFDGCLLGVLTGSPLWEGQFARDRAPDIVGGYRADRPRVLGRGSFDGTTDALADFTPLPRAGMSLPMRKCVLSTVVEQSLCPFPAVRPRTMSQSHACCRAVDRRHHHAAAVGSDPRPVRPATWHLNATSMPQEEVNRDADHARLERARAGPTADSRHGQVGERGRADDPAPGA